MFFIFPLTLILTDLLMPVNAFTFREWEALQNDYPYFAKGPFYPDQEISMTEYGDMGRHTPFEIGKFTTWKTDHIGFRNDSYIPDPDILLIGDSFIVGSSVTQNKTISSQLQYLLDSSMNGHKYKVYNIAPEPFEKFDQMLKSGLIKKPKIVVVAFTESSIATMKIPELNQNFSFKEKVVNAITGVLPYYVPMYIDRIIKFSLLRYLSVKMNPLEFIKLFKGKSDKLKQEANKANPRMLFYNGGVIINNDKATVHSNTLSVLSVYKSYCDKLGMQLIFLPLPNKESIYYEKISVLNKQPIFLMKLDSLAKSEDLQTVNVFQLFTSSRNNNPGLMLYQYDDTHWNADGINIVARELSKKILLEGK